jgi:hypothetical protein
MDRIDPMMDSLVRLPAAYGQQIFPGTKAMLIENRRLLRQIPEVLSIQRHRGNDRMFSGCQ